jgi:type II secretory pathway pseudopilin PulG
MKPLTSISKHPRKLSRGRAFTLIEVTLALGVAGFCLVSVFGLLPVGLMSNQASLEQTAAANIATGILSDLNCAQPLGTSMTPHYGISIPATGTTSASGTGTTLYLAADGSASATGHIVVTGTAVSRYCATIGFYPPAAGQRNSTAVRILITWPAGSNATPAAWPSWPTTYSGSYEADTTLDRN